MVWGFRAFRGGCKKCLGFAMVWLHSASGVQNARCKLGG